MCKKKRNILQFTYDIEECIDIIQEEISKVSFEEFVNDRKTIGYIERQLEKIGEAISQIQKLDKNILTGIFSDRSYWENIKGMRNRLIHEYWGTSLLRNDLRSFCFWNGRFIKIYLLIERKIKILK